MGTLYSKIHKLNKIQFVTEKSPYKKESEDSFFINNALGIYGVMDGSTPIDNFTDNDGHNGAYLAANLFKNHFDSLVDIEYLHKEILQVNQLLKKNMDDHHINQRDKTKLWCTCVSAIQLKDNGLLYASLGDTMIVTCDNKENVNVLTVDSVKNIDIRARIQRDIDRYYNVDIPEETYFHKKQNKIADNRKMANTPNGYSVANGMKEVENYIQYGMLDTKNLKQVLIMSDGLYDPKGDLRSVYWEIEAIGLEEYVHKLTAHEQTNKKESDDKTAILLTFR